MTNWSRSDGPYAIADPDARRPTGSGLLQGLDEPSGVPEMRFAWMHHDAPVGRAVFGVHSGSDIWKASCKRWSGLLQPHSREWRLTGSTQEIVDLATGLIRGLEENGSHSHPSGAFDVALEIVHKDRLLGRHAQGFQGGSINAWVGFGHSDFT